MSLATGIGPMLLNMCLYASNNITSLFFNFCVFIFIYLKFVSITQLLKLLYR